VALQVLQLLQTSYPEIVLSHVDADHVEGLIRLFANNPLPFVVDQVWFNGWRQIKKSHGLLGPLQGEFLSALLTHRVARAWDMDSQTWVVPTKGQIPSYTLPGGMTLTVLSPKPCEIEENADEMEICNDGGRDRTG
jgi:hypothetical protein